MNQSCQKKETNYGLSMLRMLMCFCVVLNHFWLAEPDTLILKAFADIKQLAVPVFLMVSFLLVGHHFANPTPERVINRMFRLAWPHVFWAIAYWGIYYLSGISRDVPSLLWQLATGHSPLLNTVMWYQVALLVITLLFFAAGCLPSEKWRVVMIVAAGIFALLMQYTGINYALFVNLRYEVRYPLGRLLEALPYAALGYCLFHFRVYQWLGRHRLPALAGAAILYCLAIPMVSWRPQNQFGYAGIDLLLKSLSLVTIAYLLPLEKLPGVALKGLDLASRHTLGIYCMHILVERLLFYYGLAGKVMFVFGVEQVSFGLCAVIYGICYLLAAMIALIPWKPVQQLVD